MRSVARGGGSNVTRSGCSTGSFSSSSRQSVHIQILQSLSLESFLLKLSLFVAFLEVFLHICWILWLFTVHRRPLRQSLKGDVVHEILNQGKCARNCSNLYLIQFSYALPPNLVLYEAQRSISNVFIYFLKIITNTHMYHVKNALLLEKS